MTRTVLLVSLVATAVALAGCGESESDKAQTRVCDARADISKQIDELKGLTVATATVDGVRKNVDAIQDDLKTIAAAATDLSDSRRKDVKAAADTFSARVTEIVQGATSDLSLSEAATKLKTAAQDAATAFADTLGKIDC